MNYTPLYSTILFTLLIMTSIQTVASTEEDTDSDSDCFVIITPARQQRDPRILTYTEQKVTLGNSSLGNTASSKAQSKKTCSDEEKEQVDSNADYKKTNTSLCLDSTKQITSCSPLAPSDEEVSADVPTFLEPFTAQDDEISDTTITIATLETQSDKNQAFRSFNIHTPSSPSGVVALRVCPLNHQDSLSYQNNDNSVNMGDTPCEYEETEKSTSLLDCFKSCFTRKKKKKI